jgi:hypothetical protein
MPQMIFPYIRVVFIMMPIVQKTVITLLMLWDMGRILALAIFG